MLKLGRFTAMLGVIITAIGLVTGFILMTKNPAQAKFFLMMTPVGFLLLFTGVITAILFGEQPSSRKQDQG